MIEFERDPAYQKLFSLLVASIEREDSIGSQSNKMSTDLSAVRIAGS